MSICYVDLIDACHLRCRTCVRGRRQLPNRADKMPLDLFERILDKARSEGYDTIGLYNWTEPFLNPRVDAYVEMVRAAGLTCEISTTLSFRNRDALLERSLRAGLNSLIVSVSGDTQAVHTVNHRGGDLDLVHDNLERVAALLDAPGVNTRVTLRYLRFPYNHDEEAAAAARAQRLGIGFDAFDASGDPRTIADDDSNPEAFLERLRTFTAEHNLEKRGEVCSQVMDMIVINARGRVVQCCAIPSYDFLEIGDYLDESKESLLLKRHKHPVCSDCAYPRRAATAIDHAALSAALAHQLQVDLSAPPQPQRSRRPFGLGLGLRNRLRDWRLRNG